MTATSGCGTSPTRPGHAGSGPSSPGRPATCTRSRSAAGGDTLAAANSDGSVWLWNLTTPARPRLIATLTGPTGQVYSVAFSPNGETLAATDSAGEVWLWDTRADAAIAGICRMAGQALSKAEWQAYIPGRPYARPCPTR